MKVHFGSGSFVVPWVGSAILGSGSMRHFHAQVDLQNFLGCRFGFIQLPSGGGDCFKQFSPTLRTVGLSHPRDTRRRPLGSLRPFPKLSDIKIYVGAEAYAASDTQIIPVRGGLRGHSILVDFSDEGLSKDSTVAFGWVGFTSIDLVRVQGVQTSLDVVRVGTFRILRLKKL